MPILSHFCWNVVAGHAAAFGVWRKAQTPNAGSVAGHTIPPKPQQKRRLTCSGLEYAHLTVRMYCSSGGGDAVFNLYHGYTMVSLVLNFAVLSKRQMLRCGRPYDSLDWLTELTPEGQMRQ